MPDSFATILGVEEPAEDSFAAILGLTPAPPSGPPQTALNSAQQAAMQRDEAATIRPQSRWESLLGGVPRAFAQRALSGVQALPGLAARAGSALLSTPEAMQDTAVGRGIERASDVLGGYAERQAETEELRRWQLGQAARQVGPAVAGGLELVGSAPEVAALPVVGLAGMGTKALGRTVTSAARRAGLKKAPSVPGFARAKNFLSKWFTSSRGLSPETVAAIESREANVAAARVAATAESRGLDRMISEHVAKNPGIDESALRDSVAAILAGDQPAVSVPGRMKFLAQSMRKEIDNLSQTLIDEGAVDEGLADIFQDNLGSYLTRSYRAFDDPRHIDKLKESGDWNRIKAELLKMDEFANTPDDAIEGWMESVARRDPGTFGTGGGLGTIETGIYKARKSIPKPIRDLLGEYKDPAVQYYKTAERLSRNVHTHRMFSALRDIGLREGWLSETPLPGISRVLAGEGTTRTPLGGMFTSDEMRAVIEGTMRAAEAGRLKKLSGISKELATVGSVQAQARNAQSNMLLLMSNGNLFTRRMPWGKAGKDLGLVRALRDLDLATGKRVMRAVDELDLPAVENLKASDLRGAWDEARRYGVVDSSIDIGDVKAMLAEADYGLPVEAGGRLRRFGRQTRAGFRKAYQAGDSVPKMSAWRSEQAKLRWARPDLSDVEVKARAAEIVKNTMPTYSRVPAAVEKVRQSPVIGPFVSWAAEIPRVAKNTTMQGLREIQEGARLGNSRMVKLGVHRLASQAAAFSTPQAMKAGVRALREGEPDQSLEWDVAPLLAPWVAKGQYMLSGVKGDELTVVDLSFADPFAILKDAVIASIKTGRVDPTLYERAGSALMSLAEPYLNEDIAIGALLDAWRGTTASGRTVRSPYDPLAVQAADVAGHVGKAFLPGTGKSLWKVGAGIAGVSDQYGNVRDPAIEGLALAGPRVYKVSIPKSLMFKARAFAKMKSEAGWNESVAESGNAAQKATQAYAGEHKRRRSAEDLVLAMYAASRAGLSRARIANALDSSDQGRLSKADTDRLLQGLDAYQAGPDAWQRWLDGYINISKMEAQQRREKRNR